MNKVNWQSIIIVALVIWGSVMTFFTVDGNEYAQAQKLEKERALGKLKRLEDSILVVDKFNREATNAGIKMMQEKDLIARDAVAELDKFKKREKIPFKPVASDHVRDSLIQSILQHKTLND